MFSISDERLPRRYECKKVTCLKIMRNDDIIISDKMAKIVRVTYTWGSAGGVVTN